jgi:hypothetical protein
MSADPNTTSNVNRRARGDSHPSLTPLNGPDRRLPRITSGPTRHAANRSGRTLAASIPGSSDNTDVRVNASGVPPVSSYTTDDRVNAPGVLALSPVDVRMHASDETTPSASSGVVYSPAVESPASAPSQLVDSGIGFRAVLLNPPSGRRQGTLRRSTLNFSTCMDPAHCCFDRRRLCSNDGHADRFAQIFTLAVGFSPSWVFAGDRPPLIR